MNDKYVGAHARRDPNKLAIIMAATGKTVTYGELDARSNQFAQALASFGLRFGDHIALCMDNNDRYHEVCWAAQRSGLYFTAISTRLTAEETAYIINDCGARVLVMSTALSQLAADLIPLTPKIEHRLAVGGDIAGYVRYEEFISTFPTEPLAEEIEGGPMLYSSGTTGRPKGVKRALMGMAMGELNPLATLQEDMMKMDATSVYISPAPLYHAAPLIWTMCVQRIGGTVVVMEHFDPVETLRLIEHYRATCGQFVPTMFVRMLKLPPEQRTAFDVSSLKAVIHAAAPCPVEVKRQMIEWWGPVIYEYYAGTEGNGSTFSTSQQWLEHPGTVGRAAVGQVHIVGEEGEELPPGQAGSVYFSGGGQFEYHNDPEKTRGSYNEQGWSTLGDIGYLDADGFLYLTDRKSFMIVSGGVNIYPQEIENVLVLHPKVADVAVFGVPNEEFGEEVKAIVQPANMVEAGAELEKELIEFCRSKLAHFKCPRSIDFEAELPRHQTGKLYKRLLRDRYWANRATRI